MARRISTLLETLLHQRSLKRWTLAGAAAPKASLVSLRLWAGRARALRRTLDQVIHEADHRLALPVIGSNAMKKPMGTDWAWRPSLWKGRCGSRRRRRPTCRGRSDRPATRCR